MLKITNYSVFKGSEIGAFLVNPVNVKGVMGKGLALEFKKRYKSYFENYKTLCDENKIEVGKVNIDMDRRIISFPTKSHWKNKSKSIDIKNALKDLRIKSNKLGIDSIYMPMIGSGLGGLNFNKDVLPLIKEEFKNSKIKVVICMNKIKEEQSQMAIPLYV